MTHTLHIATDGSCIQSGAFRAGSEEARPGAWAFVAHFDNGAIYERSEAFADTTIGAMEVAGLLNALRYAADHSSEMVLIKCDSQYVVHGYNDWVEGWAAKGFHKKGGLAHAPAWREIHALKSAIADRVTVEWVKAHSNTGSLNDAVDQLANDTARTQRAVARGSNRNADPLTIIDEPHPGTDTPVAYKSVLDALEKPVSTAKTTSSRKLLGYQIANAQGVNIQGDDGDPSGYPSFHILDALEAQMVVMRYDQGLLIMPIYEGDIEKPTFTGRA